jgi:hypothetical protein
MDNFIMVFRVKLSKCNTYLGFFAYDVICLGTTYFEILDFKVIQLYWKNIKSYSC